MKAARTERHNLLRDVIIGALSAWGFPVEKEPLIRHGNVHRHRGDFSLPQLNGPLIGDVSIIQPSVMNTQQNLSSSSATLVRERTKFRKYQDLCKRSQKSFLPFVFQTLGGIGNRGLDFLNELKSRPPCLQVFDPPRYVDALRVSLSCRLLRVNSQIVSRWLQLVLPKKSGGVAV